MQTPSKNPEFTATISIFGDVFAPDFPEWISRHANKLGLHSLSTIRLEDCLKLEAIGAPDMLDAFALGCSLGPQSVMVDQIEYTTAMTA
jgi:hypothetical protein